MRSLVLLLLILVAAGFGIFAYQKAKPSEIGQTESSKITAVKAVEKVKELPEVQQYLKDVPDGKVEVDNENGAEINVHIYEVKNGHTATFNWYKVGIKNGRVEPQFETNQGMVSGKLCYPSEVLPKGTIEAKRLMDEKIFKQDYAGSLAGARNTYSFELEPGEYSLRYQPSTGQNGYSTTVCPTGKEETCRDTQQRIARKVSVELGQNVSDYDLCDYYFQDSNAPKF